MQCGCPLNSHIMCLIKEKKNNTHQWEIPKCEMQNIFEQSFLLETVIHLSPTMHDKTLLLSTSASWSCHDDALEDDLLTWPITVCPVVPQLKQHVAWLKRTNVTLLCGNLSLPNWQTADQTQAAKELTSNTVWPMTVWKHTLSWTHNKTIKMRH